jgi:hypothetical protein
MPVPAYLDWLYDAVCFKASHNSYQGSNDKPQNSLGWNFKEMYNAGCRGFELDLYQCDTHGAAAGCEWSVSHEGAMMDGKLESNRVMTMPIMHRGTGTGSASRIWTCRRM